ncbi:MAG: hypothetical protein HQK50_15170 [Oligoflexia bacterium]|nr:hypothetical protein [Oligoflexia bacterium]MBF0366914.1 hypothetical protein [Oligoflexia bacterium]
MENKILNFVAMSPQMVKIQDKEHWLSLFSTKATIQDPIGSKIYKYQELSHFWDAFIANNDISFQVLLDLVDKSSLAPNKEVVRDVLIHTKLAGTQLQISVPAHLFYVVQEEEEKLSILSMQAHWDLSKMVWQFLKQKGSLLAITKFTWKIFKNVGPSGIAGFTKALFWGIKQKGEKIVHQVATASPPQARGHFAKSAILNFSLEELASFKIINTRSAGYFTTFSFEKHGQRGVGQMRFCPFTHKIVEAKIYN